MRVLTNRTNHGASRQTTGFYRSIVVGLLLTVAPKCPLCWGIYVSVCGAGTLNLLSYQRWAAPLLALFLVFNLGALFYYAQMRKTYGPFLLNLFGALTIVAGMVLDLPEGMFPGIALVLIGSTLGVYRVRQAEMGHCQRNKCLSASGKTNGKTTFGTGRA